MPLLKSKSKKAFSENVSEMMHHGHPQAQALAAAYAMKRKAEHKAHGGKMCAHGGPVHCKMGCYAEGGEAEHPLDKRVRQHNELQAKRGESYGNEGTGVHSPSYSYGRDRGASMAGDLVRGGSYKRAERLEGAKDIHRQTLREAHHMKGPTSGKSGFAHGGMAYDEYEGDEDNDMDQGYQSDAHELDMIDRIMAKRMAEGGETGHEKGVHTAGRHRGFVGGTSLTGEWQREHNEAGMEPSSKRQYREAIGERHKRVLNELREMKGPHGNYSHGGQVANNEHEFEAEFHEPDCFDDLALRDSDMEDADYTGANSGDEDGSHLNQEEGDMIDRIMRKRKQRNPRPA